ncbi:MAG: diadenylate cyclase CdaA [Clostridia bacterium]|nr:diadenylate cyclase CdaA [Clostridia bacterium]
MGEVWTFLIQNLRLVRFRDVIDILIVAFVIYGGIRLVKETRAAQLVKGIIALIVAAQLADWLDLNAISYLLSSTLQVGVLAIIIMFQPEIRRSLEKIGNITAGSQIFGTADAVESMADAVSEAAGYMSERRIGALIILERNTKLGDIMKSGTMLNAQISPQLLINIFMSNTPLHDGASIIGDNMIKAAACFLPLTQNNSFSKELGTRHRAAIGVSEIADCVSVVVSEETGKISVAIDGDLRRNISSGELKNLIIKEIGNDDNSADKAAQKLPFINKIVDWAVKKK